MEKFYFTESQRIKAAIASPKYYEGISIRVILADEHGNADSEYGIRLQFQSKGQLCEPILQMNPSELGESLEYFEDFIEALKNRSHRLGWLKPTEAIEILKSLGYEDLTASF